LSAERGIAPIASDTQSLVDRATHAVRRAILEGRLRPGELLRIGELASDLGVSPSPVREALQRLAEQGLVVLRPARTAIVAPLELDDLHEIYRLRRQIEVDAVGRAASKLTDDDLRSIEESFDRFVAAEIDTNEFWESHNAFHLALMAPVITPRLERMVTDLWHSAERYIRVVYDETDVLFTRSPRERHQPLLDAARTRNRPTLRKALTTHLQDNEREIAESLRQTLGGPPARD
jgi:DNA-binding GntR family transcriptional regulator